MSQQIDINVLKPHPRNNEFFDDLNGEEFERLKNSIRDEKIYNDFYQYQQRVWKYIQDNQISQEVEIISIGKVGGKKSAVWKVDFKTYEVSQRNRNGDNGSLILRTRYWTASVTAHFVPERLFMGRRLINPLGFTVTRYNQSEVQF